MTVSALTLNGQSLKKELARFQGAGYQLWLDDFGSGYSSLNVLQEFSFDELKIDMAFLRNFNEESRKIIQSIILMAKNLSIHTLAEGAETREQNFGACFPINDLIIIFCFRCYLMITGKTKYTGLCS